MLHRNEFVDSLHSSNITNLFIKLNKIIQNYLPFLRIIKQINPKARVSSLQLINYLDSVHPLSLSSAKMAKRVAEKFIYSRTLCKLHRLSLSLRSNYYIQRVLD